MKIKKRLIGILLLVFTQVFSFLYAGYNKDSSENPELQIKLRPTNLVVGNQIILGDISDIYLPDMATLKRFSEIKIGQAPPPGESIEITLRSIKKKIKMAGMANYIPYLTGPKTIRVETAHREIDKAFVHEQLAFLINH